MKKITSLTTSKPNPNSEKPAMESERPPSKKTPDSKIPILTLSTESSILLNLDK